MIIKSLFWHQNPKTSRVILHRKGHITTPAELLLSQWALKHAIVVLHFMMKNYLLHNVKYLAHILKYNNGTSHISTPDVTWTYLEHICISQRMLLLFYSSTLQSDFSLLSFRFRALVFWIASNFITGVPARDDYLKCPAVLTPYPALLLTALH